MRSVSLLPTMVMLASVLASILVFGLISGCGDDDADAPLTPAVLSGSWQSAACETWPVGEQTFYLFRRFTFTETTWEIRSEVHVDEVCSGVAVVNRFGGNYRLGEPIDDMPGGYNGDFDVDYVFVTPMNDVMVTQLTDAACGQQAWQVGEEQEVAKACPMIPPPATCDTQYDIVQYLDGQLYFGAEDLLGDLFCEPEHRPEEVQEFAVERAQP